MLDGKIAKAGKELGIVEPEDWCKVRPEQILAVHDCGPATLDHLRLYLAARGLTLLNDETPAYWQENLAAVKIGGQIAQTDRAFVLPFTILVDTAEQLPFAFQGFTGDSDNDGRPMLVRTELCHLGPTHGDYAIKGMEGLCHVERKGPGDAIGTFLAHGERRDRWERTLEFLAEIPCAAVVVECSFGKLLSSIEARGSRSKSTLQKTLHCQVLAWEQDWRIPFVFCDSRRFAELTTLRIMMRFYRHQQLKKTAEERIVDELLEGIL
jgi:hypothetical protein